MSNFQYDFFMSQIEIIRDIKENEKIKISLVMYEGVQGPCIFKVCKNRNLSDVCEGLKTIRHPNVAVVYDYLYADGNTYIIEEYIEGSTLKELLLQNGCFSEKETVRIMCEICDGLEVLHRRKPPIVHNDINPSNIIIRNDNSVKIFDFDISRTYKEGVSKNTRLFGTEEYAAPEHYGYKQSEPRTDIYSLGVTMHEMLTGEQLDSQHKITYKGRLKKIIKKCTEVDSKNRYSSVTELKKALKKKFANRLKKILITAIVLWFLLFIGGLLSVIVELENETRQAAEVGIVQQSGDSTVFEEDSEETKKQNPLNEKSDQKQKEANKEELSSAESKSEVVSSKMTTIAEISGTLESMVALDDGRIVYFENYGSSSYLKDSTGQEKESGSFSTRCILGYDGYKDKLYLFAVSESSTFVYLITEELAYEELASVRYVPKVERYENFGFRSVQFYSNGVVKIAPNVPLIDTNTWMVVGDSEEYDAVINDCEYSIWLDPSAEQYRNIQKADNSGEIVQELQIPEDIKTQALSEIPVYQNDRMFYFMGTCDGKQNVYGFDGQQISMITCLDDYKYYSQIEIGDWCVAKEKIWIYDLATDTIKEFPLK